VEKRFEEYAETTADRFGVIANFEVLEHLFSPHDFLRAVWRRLEPGGLVVLTCPNGEGFDIQALGAVSESVDHEHLNYLSPSSLRHLLTNGGFDVVEVTTPGRLDAELVRNKVQAGEFDLSGQPFLRRVLLDEWERLGDAFQAFLIEHGLSSNMWAVASKVT
jgi:SAM-dependent methyltransferase